MKSYHHGIRKIEGEFFNRIIMTCTMGKAISSGKAVIEVS